MRPMDHTIPPFIASRPIFAVSNIDGGVGTELLEVEFGITLRYIVVIKIEGKEVNREYFNDYEPAMHYAEAIAL